MRIIGWNCQGGFRGKTEKILALNPDIVVVPECENEEKLKFGSLTPKPNDFIWYGDTQNKGIGIFSYSDHKLELLKLYNPDFKYILPIKVTKDNRSFILLAIWTVPNNDNKEAKYIGQVKLALDYYKDILDNNNTVIIGDFNSNKTLDKNNRVGTHTDVVNKLKESKILSLYHITTGQEQGAEETPTFFWRRKRQDSFHLDYCFVSEDILANKFCFTVGNADDWLSSSDHMPIIADIHL